MSTVIFGSSFSFLTVATPSTGWLVGYDTDGIIKQKDSNGVITPIGGGPTAGNAGTYSLSQVLSVGNNSQNYSIIMGTSTNIRSSRGGGQLNLDFAQDEILLSNDNSLGLKSKLYLSDGSIDLINSTTGSVISLKSDKVDIVNGSTASGPSGNRIFINSNKSDGRVLLGVGSNTDVLVISASQGSSRITTNSTKEGVILSSQNSYFDESVRNSVILGGDNVIGLSSDSVYVPRVIIENTGTIGTEVSNSNIEFNDEVINIYNSNSVISLSTSTASTLLKNGIILVDNTSSSQSPSVDSGVTYISTNGSTATQSLINTVIIGGSNLSADSSNTVYLGNFVNINNAYTLPSTDGSSGNVLKTDGSGNVTWQSDTGSDAEPLNLTLAKGNDSATYSIIMGTSTNIRSANGGGQIDLDFSGLSSRVLISTDNGGISTAYVELDNSDINIESSSNLKITTFDSEIQSGNGEGLKYAIDYSSTFVDRSLVDKEFVDTATASIWNRIIDAATGSGNTGYVPKWNTSTNISGTSSVYISNSSTENTVQTTITGNNDPYDVAFDSFNERIYVVNSGSNNVTITNAKDLSLIGTVSVGTFPNAITFDSDNNRMYVANRNSNNVSVINTLNNTVISTISVDTLPVGIENDNINDRIFVSCQTSNIVSVISKATNTISATISVSSPRGLAYDYDNDNLYISGVGPDKIACVDTSTNTITATISVGTNPYGLAYDSTNSRIYVTNYISNDVSVVDVTTNTVIATISVGTNPDSVVFDNLNSRIYVTNNGSADVSVISTTTNTVISTIDLVSGSPRGLAYDNLNSKVYVANFGSDRTEVIETISREDGYVGLNTIYPTSELDVRGKLTTKEFRLPTGANSGYYLVSDESGNATWQYPIVEVIGGTGLTGSGASGSITISVDLLENGGLTFSGNEITADFSSLVSTLQGNGLTANGGVLDVNVGNGLSITNDVVELGGTLDKNTTINGNGFTFSMGGLDRLRFTASQTNTQFSSLSLNDGFILSISDGVQTNYLQSSYLTDISIVSIDSSGTSSVVEAGTSGPNMNIYDGASQSRIQINTVNQTIGSGDGSSNNRMVITDEFTAKGLVYYDDYSSNFTTYSLVTKGYVDSQVTTATSKYSESRSFTASVTETITHSLGTDEIIVQTYDSTGVMVIPGTVQTNGLNDVDITFSSTLSNIKIIIIG